MPLDAADVAVAYQIPKKRRKVFVNNRRNAAADPLGNALRQCEVIGCLIVGQRCCNSFGTAYVPPGAVSKHSPDRDTRGLSNIIEINACGWLPINASPFAR